MKKRPILQTKQQNNVETQCRTPIQRTIQVQMISIGIQKFQTQDFCIQTATQSIHRHNSTINKQQNNKYNKQQNNQQNKYNNQYNKQQNIQGDQRILKNNIKSDMKQENNENYTKQQKQQIKVEKQSQCKQYKQQQQQLQQQENKKQSYKQLDTQQIQTNQNKLQNTKQQNSKLSQSQQSNQIQSIQQSQLLTNKHKSVNNYQNQQQQPNIQQIVTSNQQTSQPINNEHPYSQNLPTLYKDNNQQSYKNSMIISTIQHKAPIRQQLYGEQNQHQKNIYDTLFDKKYPHQKIIDFSLNYKTNFDKWISTSQLKTSNHKSIPLFHPSLDINPDLIFGSSKYNIGFNRNNLKSYRKLLKIIAIINPLLVSRLFETSYANKNIYGIWLCDHYEWKCCIIDDKVPADNQDHPSNTNYNNFQQSQSWLFLLEKALAIVLGGYDKLQNVSVGKLFHMITGSNILTYKIHEDPSKTDKLLKNIKNCLKKNFMVYCQNSVSNTLSQKSKRDQTIFVIKDIKNIDQNQTVIELQNLVDGKQQRFWVKANKFIQQFSSVEILQIRLNHNNSRISTIHNGKNMTIIQLNFHQDCFGGITLSNKNRSGFLKTYLYRQSQQNILKLVGKAQQKNKQQLFFDCLFNFGTYFLFVETQHRGSSITYFGEGYPQMKIKQQISANGYKNDFTQYLPINSHQIKSKTRQYTSSRMPLSSKTNLLDSKKSILNQKTSQIENMGKIREKFIEYLLKTDQPE